MMKYRGFDGMFGGFGLKGYSLGTVFAVLFFGVTFFLSLPAYAAVTQEETSILVSSSTSGSTVRFIKGVEDGWLRLEKDVTFKVKAYVEPVTISEETVYAQREFNVPEKEFVCQKPPCTRKWGYSFSDKPVSFSEFPRFQLVWSQAAFGATPEVHVELSIVPGGDDNDVIHLFGHFSEENESVLTPFKTIDIKNAEYVEKSTWYLAKRELGFEADERWRYEQDGKNLVLQARVDLPLKEVQAVQIFFDSNKIPKLEWVQFSVDTNGNGRRDIFILSEQTKHNLKKKGGSSILTLDLCGAMKSLGIDPEKAILQEPIIFLPTNFPLYKQDMPIEKIVFPGVDRLEDQEIIKPEVKQRGEQYSLDFDFSEALEDLSIWDAKLDNLKITVDLDGPQIITWDRVRIFDAWEAQVPVLSKEPGRALRDWIRQEDAEMTESDKDVGEPSGSRGQIKSFRPLWIQRYGSDLDRKNIIPTMADVEMGEWRSGDTINGEAYCSVSGAMDNSVIHGEITVERQQETKTAPVYLLLGFNSLTPLVQNGARIKNFEIEAPIYMDQGALSLDVAIFDIQTSAPGEAADYRTAEWWTKGVELPFSVQGKKLSPDDKGETILVFPKVRGKNKYSYALGMPKENSILPLEFILPGQLPQPCVATLKINDRNTVIPYGPYTLSLLSFGPISGEFEFTIEYFGEKQIIEMPIPRIRVMALRHTPEDELKKIGVLIDDKSVGLRVTNVPAPEGEWIDMGSVTVEEGEHAIQVEESPYFRIKTLLLETDTPLPWPHEKETQVEATSFWKRVVLLGLKFLFVVAVLFLMYLFRSKIRAFLRSVFQPILNLFSKTYWRLPDLAWTIIWAVAGGGMYCTGLTRKSSGENHGFTFGGIAMVLVIWHLSSVLKNHISRRFPNAAEYTYRSSSTPFFAWAIGLLVVTAVLLVIRLEPLAEQVAVVVYYLLVVGVIGEIVGMRKTEDRGLKAEGRKWEMRNK